ncbi:MAG TPA: cytochrome ubiquinol oxidase subunit I [candidate division Zixibacteria bacterium]|jgi:cytochrome bd-type quinol oxidase subunit 1
MDYPIFDPGPIGPSTLIAVIAILHVVIAQFAVGAGIATPWLEARAHRRGDRVLAGFLLRYARFLILLSFVAGAVTGVGIWFVIGLIAPETTALLLRQFVWGWATEWVFFLVEIISGYVYYFYWDRLPTRTHIKIGWVYAVAAWGSLFIINGILTFMLTPGDWLTTGSFWDGWLNPTFWPSLVLRTISSLALAGLFVAIVANIDRTLDREQKRHVINEGSIFLVPLALMIPVSVWFFAQSPHQAGGLVMGGAVAMSLFFAFGIAASTLIGLYAYFGLIRNKRYVSLETALLLAGIALVATGAMEYVREGIRKPYVVYDYLYANGLTRAQLERFDREGFFSEPMVAADGFEPSTATSIERGRVIYKIQCQRCHAVDGYNAIRPLIDPWTIEMIRDNTRQLHRLKPFMPPFGGTDSDLEDLVSYLASLRSEQWRQLDRTGPAEDSQ